MLLKLKSHTCLRFIGVFCIFNSILDTNKIHFIYGCTYSAAAAGSLSCEDRVHSSIIGHHPHWPIVICPALFELCEKGSFGLACHGSVALTGGGYNDGPPHPAHLQNHCSCLLWPALPRHFCIIGGKPLQLTGYTAATAVIVVHTFVAYLNCCWNINFQPAVCEFVGLVNYRASSLPLLRESHSFSSH